MFGIARFRMVSLALCGLLAAGAADAQTVKIATLGVLADAPFYIAKEKGYFDAEKIEVEIERFNSGQQALAPLSTNQVQVVGGGLSAGFFNAFARGWPVSVVMARARDIPKYSGNALVVRQDLKATVNSVAALKGMKIAVNAPAASMQFMLGKMLEAEGLKLSDVEMVYMPWPNMSAAFASKAIDAGTTVEPFTDRFNQGNVAFTLKRSSDVLRDPPLEVAVLLYNTDWANQNTDQAKRFSVAYLRGARDFTNALQGGPMRAEVVSILTKHTGIKEAAVYDRIGWTWMDPNGEVSLDGLREQQDWYAAQGQIPKKVPVEEMIDRRFLDHALSKLGRVESK